ncbi:hypothetical protein Syun_007800 [Stephania yunnanensis]|uniref:Uncharacterized protein n=1 Tax=Stephania yunnanensis TaxID=152371 RepID=A0AAP0L2X0_9MAGN
MSESQVYDEVENHSTVREVCANGLRMETSAVEAKLDEGNIQEAESSLREGLSLNFEEARALLGRLEYQRGNLDSAVRVFDGIDLHAAIQRLQPSITEKRSSRRSRSNESVTTVSQHATGLLLEAIYLKVKSLQKLGMIAEAAQECKSILDAVETIFQSGIPDAQVENKLQETVSKAVELLPELWRQVGNHQETVSAYRRALLSQWGLDDDSCGRIQKAFALFLLYSGVEANPPSLASQVEDSYVPKNNIEEAILLLMILLKKFHLGKMKWDPSVMEHLIYAFSICGQASALASQIEEILPGVVHRCDRWNTLALSYSAAGRNKVALDLLRKSLHKHERPDDLLGLLLAARICSEDSLLAFEGVGYARRAVANAIGRDEHLKGVGLRMLGHCLRKQAKVASSDTERSHLQSEALKSFNEAIAFERDNPDILIELGVQYAEQRNSNAALVCAKQFIDVTGGSLLKGWRLLALVLSAQQRYSEAEVVTDAALDETAKWEQGPLLKMKAKLKIAQLMPMDAIETYRFLLALLQAQRKSFGSPGSHMVQVEDDNEFEVWLDLAKLYSRLSQWKDAEICLEKAEAFKPYSAAILHTEGVMQEGRGQVEEAWPAYLHALMLDPDHAPALISIGELLRKKGSMSLPVARSFLCDALRLEPTNRAAWYCLGMIHKDDGCTTEASDCFQAAAMLAESDPIESFSSVL